MNTINFGLTAEDYRRHRAGFPPALFERLAAHGMGLANQRDLIHLCNNIRTGLHLTIYKNGQAHKIPLANPKGHARWISWQAEAAYV